MAMIAPLAAAIVATLGAFWAGRWTASKPQRPAKRPRRPRHLRPRTIMPPPPDSPAAQAEARAARAMDPAIPAGRV